MREQSKDAYKILLVDDEPLILNFTSRLLQSEGHEVITAENGARAADQLSLSSFDLVITDINMPEMDGIELLDLISRNHKSTSVILLTGYNNSSLADAFSKGAKKLLPKPFNIDELLDAIDNICAPPQKRWFFSGEHEGATVDLRFENPQSAFEQGEIELGSGGFKLQSQKKLTIGEEYLFRFTFDSDEDHSFSLIGVIEWMLPAGSGQFSYGIKIISADSVAMDFLLERHDVLAKIPFIPAA